MASADYYLKIDGIEGESKTEGFEKQLQIESWSWGSSNSGSAAQGSGLGTGKAVMQDFHFVVQNGKASVQLGLHNWKGTHIPNAVLTCRRTSGDGTPQTYYEVTFKECVISSFQEGGSNGSDILPMVQISFNYSKVAAVYFEQDQRGQNTRAKTVTYDLKLNKAEGQ